jgi:hypothetical protein
MRFWAGHLAATGYSPEVAQIAGKFVLGHFFFWLEVLSLLRAVGSAAQALSNFIKWIGEVGFESCLEIQQEINQKVQDPRMVETVAFARDWEEIHQLFRGCDC